MPLTPEAIAILSRVSTATITTVLLKKGLRNVWLRGSRPLRPGQPRLVGSAFTLRFVPAREDLATPESWSSPISTRTAIEANGIGAESGGESHEHEGMHRVARQLEKDFPLLRVEVEGDESVAAFHS